MDPEITPDAPVVEPASNSPEAAQPAAPLDAKPAEAKPAEPNYDYVPAKFMKPDGTPDFEKLAKSYTGLERKLGSKGNIPAASIDEYDYTPPEGETLELDPTRVAEFKAKVLEKGFTKEQYQFIMDTHRELIGEMTWTAEKVESTLKQEWGANYDTLARAAQVGFSEFAPSDVSLNDPVFNHPAVMKLLARVGMEVGEDSVSNKSGTPGHAPAMTAAEIEKLRTSPEYWSDPKVHAQVTEWYAKNRR